MNRPRLAARAAGIASVVALLALGPLPAPAQQQPGGRVGAQTAPTETITIGYIEVTDDARYVDKGAFTGIRVKTVGRPFVAAEMAIDESVTVARAVRKNFVLEKAEVADADAMAARIESWRKDQNIQLILIDAPANVLDPVARKTKSLGVLLFNVSAPDDRLRGKDCQANVMHTMPSNSMLMDGLIQFVISKKWRNILALYGPLPEDGETLAAFERSVKRFGARLVDKKPFILSNDPREREKNNIPLMTSSTSDYDVVFIADYDGEFSRYAPYTTNRARPIIGATGLVPDAWHWALDKFGATQVQSRFDAKAKRHMLTTDWAAWAAVKAVINASIRARTAESDKIAGYMRGDSFRLDAGVGIAQSFRPWNNQLRMPIMLATADAVIDIAPIEGFLHQTNELDTLGEDRPDTTCKF